MWITADVPRHWERGSVKVKWLEDEVQWVFLHKLIVGWEKVS